MPDLRMGRAWIPMLVALLALLAFAPLAGARDDDGEPISCTAGSTQEDCWDDEDSDEEESDDDEFEDEESDDEESDDEESDDDESEDEEIDEPKPEVVLEEPTGDEHESCDDEPVARGADRRGKGRGRGRGRSKHEQSADSCLPEFARGFVSRVWKLVGEVDFYADGELSMTLGGIVNLPRKFRKQDDELLDQDAMVLVSERVRVIRDGERVSRDELDTAETVRVHGKVLRAEKWWIDEDGSPVTTIRAKKVYITG